MWPRPSDFLPHDEARTVAVGRRHGMTASFGQIYGRQLRPGDPSNYAAGGAGRARELLSRFNEEHASSLGRAVWACSRCGARVAGSGAPPTFDRRVSAYVPTGTSLMPVLEEGVIPDCDLVAVLGVIKS